jgi:hypothetical protein
MVSKAAAMLLALRGKAKSFRWPVEGWSEALARLSKILVGHTSARSKLRVLSATITPAPAKMEQSIHCTLI